MKYCLPSIWPSSLYSSGTLSQFASLLVSISWTRPCVDVELLPAGVEVEDVGLAAALHLGEDVGVGVAELEGHLGVGLASAKSIQKSRALRSRSTRGRAARSALRLPPTRPPTVRRRWRLRCPPACRSRRRAAAGRSRQWLKGRGKAGIGHALVVSSIRAGMRAGVLRFADATSGHAARSTVSGTPD